MRYNSFVWEFQWIVDLVWMINSWTGLIRVSTVNGLVTAVNSGLEGKIISKYWLNIDSKNCYRMALEDLEYSALLPYEQHAWSFFVGCKLQSLFIIFASSSTAFRISPFVLHRRKKAIWVWNDMRVSKWSVALSAKIAAIGTFKFYVRIIRLLPELHACVCSSHRETHAKEWLFKTDK